MDRDGRCCNLWRIAQEDGQLRLVQAAEHEVGIGGP